MYWCAYFTLHSQDESLGSEQNLQGGRQWDKERHLSAAPPNNQPPHADNRNTAQVGCGSGDSDAGVK